MNYFFFTIFLCAFFSGVGRDGVAWGGGLLINNLCFFREPPCVCVSHVVFIPWRCGGGGGYGPATVWDLKELVETLT